MADVRGLRRDKDTDGGHQVGTNLAGKLLPEAAAARAPVVEVDDRVAPPQGPAQRPIVEERAGPVAHRACVDQPADLGPLGRGRPENLDLRALAEQPRNEVGPDKTATPRDANATSS